MSVHSCNQSKGQWEQRLAWRLLTQQRKRISSMIYNGSVSENSVSWEANLIPWNNRLRALTRCAAISEYDWKIIPKYIPSRFFNSFIFILVGYIEGIKANYILTRKTSNRIVFIIIYNILKNMIYEEVWFCWNECHIGNHNDYGIST